MVSPDQLQEKTKKEKGAGGQASGELGKGRKGSLCTSLLTGETTVLADIEGPGIIQHIFSRLQIKQKKDVLF